MSNDLFQTIARRHVQSEAISHFESIGGGCINEAFKIVTPKGCFFLKWNDQTKYDLFLKEEIGLNCIRQLGVGNVPNILGRGIVEKKAYLLLEWVEPNLDSPKFWVNFGILLSKLHRHSSKTFGFDHDNYIGKLPQPNQKHKDWHEFFVHERLMPQVALGVKNKLIDNTLQSNFEKLYEKIEHLVPKEAPSFLHGDLWSGNFIIDQRSSPVLIDPAIYFGHRETELAFTHLFNGFNALFYQSYAAHFPLEPGFKERIDLHNLYPLLVHLNLFGFSYLHSIIRTVNRYT